MQLHNVESHPVEAVGGGKRKRFGISMNRKAFRVLSDGLYKDKIGSIVRETACNAADSHTAAGTPDRKFSIHMPDALEPWYSVRDYGVGLSPEAIDTVFCQYFESTKDTSNNEVGGFGLGAKTPFAYTDQFTVTSIYNGTMRSYSAIITDEGPDMILMVEAPSDEGNGVEISIGVKQQDFREFINAVKTQLRFFPVKPDILNYSGTFEFQQEGEALFESKNIRVLKNGGYRPQVHIVQGPVGYPMDFNEINKHLNSDDSAFLRMITEVGGNLYFNIGEIGVIASREGIEYNEFTINNIKAKIEVARKELTTYLETQIATLPNVFEKAKFINEKNALRPMLSAIKIDLAPAKRDTMGRYYLALGKTPEFYEEQELPDHYGNKVKKNVNVIGITTYTRSGMSGFTGSRNSSVEEMLFPEQAEKTVIVLRDTAKSPVAKLRHYFKENGFERMLVLATTSEKVKFDAKFIKAITTQMGGFNKIVLASTLPDAPKSATERLRTDYSRPTAYLANSNGHDDLDSVANWTRVYDKLDALTNADDEDVEEAVYVVVDRQRTEGIAYASKSIFNDLVKAEVIDLPVFGIRKADVEKLADSGIKWHKFDDYVEAKRAEVIANPNIKRYSVAQSINNIIEGAIGQRFRNLVPAGLHSRTRIARLMRVQDKAKAIAANASVNSHMLRIAGYDADKHPAITAIRNSTLNVFEGAPLMRYMTRVGYGPIATDEVPHVVEYLNHFAVKN